MDKSDGYCRKCHSVAVCSCGCDAGYNNCPVGPIGPVGPRGETGPAGPRGPQGGVGPVGAPGMPGCPGMPGPMGPQGPKGDTGDKGDAGPQGLAGPAGPQGPKGDKGDAGAQGPSGAQGPIGPVGPAGVAGAAGAQGPKGDAGPQGPAGSVGPAGPQGIPGIQGMPGANGRDGAGVSILGSYATSADLTTAHPTGNTGDAYLVGGDLYVWNGQAWASVGQIRGPQGVQGPQGSPGPAGSQGPKGDTGPQGPPGQRGDPATAQFGSVTNTGATTFSSGAPLTFSRDEAFAGVSIDGNRTTLTLPAAGYWRITVGASVASITGTPTLNLRRDGADTSINLPITATGVATFDWIYNFPANTKLAFTVQGGQITLTDACNAYFNVVKYTA